MSQVKQQTTAPFWIVGVVIIIVAVFLATVFTIDQTEVGVLKTFGKVHVNELGPGLHFKIPLVQTLIRMPVFEQTLEMVDEDQIIALTNEGLQVKFDLAVQYVIIPTEASRIHSELQNYDVWIRSRVRSTARDIVADYGAESLYTSDRAAVQAAFEQQLSEALAPKGFEVRAILLREVSLPGSVAERISQKIEAKQEAERMEFVIDRESLEKDRKIIEAEGIARANEIISDSLSEDYLRWYWIQNLDKHDSVLYVPVGNDGIPLFKGVS